MSIGLRLEFRMSFEFAIADTCFLIDWARYRRRDVLFKLFKTVFVSEAILREIVSENTIAWISKSIAEDRLSLYTEDVSEIQEARDFVEESRRIPHIPSIDLPEALCIVIGRRRNYIVLTENRGAIIAASLIDRYKDVIIWKSLEILIEAIKRGVLEINCSNPSEIFDEYMNDTLHFFPRDDLNMAIEVVREICGKM